MTGTKFSKNMKRLKRENQMKADAARPLAEFEQEFGQTAQDAAAAITHEADFEAQLDEYLEDDRETSTERLASCAARCKPLASALTRTTKTERRREP